MTPAPYTEDTLVQQLGWRSVYAHNNEDFGPDSRLLKLMNEEEVS